MKKLISYPFSLITGLALVVVLFYTSSFALDVIPDEGVGNIGDAEILGGQEGPTANPTCVDHYDSWPHSTEFNPDSEWNLDYFPVVDVNTEPGFRQYMDINGDGLLDFVYVRKLRRPQYYPEHNDTYACLMLNNGHGWDLAHRCVVKRKQRPEPHQNEHEIMYYGDCALIEE